MYGGSAEDYLPDVEISSATVDMYRVFTDLGTQWRIAPSGNRIGLEYASLPFVLSCHEMQPDPQTLRDIRVMESAALLEINKEE